MASASIFFDFNLPNATTWFYFSFLLAVALFFKFSRLLSVRNWDIVTVFLLVPGLLVIQEARPRPTTPEKNPALAVASAVGGAVPTSSLTPITSLARTAELGPAPVQLLWLGYLWLLCGSAYFLVRCVFDLALVRRPALPPNLSFGGLAWLGGALFVCLVAVAFRQPEVNSPTPSRGITTPVAENGVTSEGARQVAVGRQSPLVQLAQRPFPLWVMRSLAVLCHLAVVVGLVGIGWRHFLDAPAGIAAATFYLMLPYTGLYVGQVHHVWPTALIVWAIAFFRRPMVAGAFLGLAAGTIYFPVVLLPLWLSFYWGRGVGRFAAAFFVTAGLMVACTALILWLRPDWAQHIGETIAASDWQPWKVPNAEGIWTGVHWAYRIPVFILYLALVLMTALWPAPKNLAHVIALSAVVLVGIQFWYADQGGVYVLWYLPLLLLLVFRPNLSDRSPTPIQIETDWLVRTGAAVRRFICRLLGLPEPFAHAR